MEAKKRLAFEIVKLYHGEEAANKALEEFERTFQRKELPEDVPTVEVTSTLLQMSIADLLTTLKLVSSKNEAKRLIKQGAIEINGEPIKDWRKVASGDIIRIGKWKFVKLVVKR